MKPAAILFFAVALYLAISPLTGIIGGDVSRESTQIAKYPSMCGAVVLAREEDPKVRFFEENGREIAYSATPGRNIFGEIAYEIQFERIYLDSGVKISMTQGDTSIAPFEWRLAYDPAVISNFVERYAILRHRFTVWRPWFIRCAAYLAAGIFLFGGAILASRVALDK